MFLRCFAVMQVSLTLLVSRNFVASAVSVNDDEVCVPPEIAELAKYLKEFDYAEASISNATSPFSYMESEDLKPSSGKEVEIETVPFGLFPVDWRRLRLLHDCLTPSDEELKAKLITVYKILSFANERLHPKFIKPTEYITSTEESIIKNFSSTIKKYMDYDTTRNISRRQTSTTERTEWELNNSTSGVNDRRDTDEPEENAKTVSFNTTDDGQLVHRPKHRTSTFNEENGYLDFLASTVEPKLSPEVEGARETTLSGEITTPGDSSSSLTNFARKNKEDFHSTTFYDQGNSFLEREYAVNSTNNYNNHDGDDNDDDDDDDDDNDGGINISTLKNLTIIDPELIKTVETNNLENSSITSSKVVSELEEEYRELEEVGSGDETKEKFVDRLKNIDINENIFRTTKSNFLETSEEFKTVSNVGFGSESEDEIRAIDQDSLPYDRTTIESRLLNSGSEEYAIKKPSVVNLDEGKSVTKILKFSSGEIFEGSANVGSQSYDSVTLEIVTENGPDFNPVKLTSEEIKPDESNEKIGTTFPSIESVSDKPLLKFKEESVYSKHTNTDEKVIPSIFETGNNFKGSESTSVLKKGAVELSTDFYYINEGVVSTDSNRENSVEEFPVTSFDQKNTDETNNRTIETSTNTVENNRWYFTTFLPAVTESTNQISPLNEYTKDTDSDTLSEISKPTELVVLIGDEKPEPAEGIQVSRGSLQDHIGNTYYFRNDPIDSPVVKKLPSYHHYEMDNSVDGSRGSKSSENDSRITVGRRGQDAVTSEELTPPVFAPFHPLLLAGKKPTRKHKLTTTWGKGFSKRGDRNTDLEKLFRWFYKLGETSIEKTVGTMEESEVLVTRK